jgi:NAD(P)-dependent dehydrogenase (short-subunit alcohol dehydrogenase family)
MSGYKAEKETVLYSMTKAAVITFSRVLGFELAAHNIRVVSVSPGNVATPLIKKSVEDEAAFRKVDKRTVESEYGRISMLHRMAEPDEIASVVAFCLSDSASFITGSDILVDGGSVAKSYELS